MYIVNVFFAGRSLGQKGILENENKVFDFFEKMEKALKSDGYKNIEVNKKGMVLNATDFDGYGVVYKVEKIDNAFDVFFV